MSAQSSHLHDSHSADDTWLVAARQFVTRRSGHLMIPGDVCGIDLVDEAGPEQDRWTGDDA